MKKKLIGFLVCIMLTIIAFSPNISAYETSYDEKDAQTFSKNNIIEENEMVQQELKDSILPELDPQLILSPTGWNFLEPCLNRFPIGFEIVGEAWGKESFNSLIITKTRVSGVVFFLLLGRPIKLRNSNLVLEYWYLVYGKGQFDVFCRWTWNGESHSTGGRFEVDGLKVSLVTP